MAQQKQQQNDTTLQNVNYATKTTTAHNSPKPLFMQPQQEHFNNNSTHFTLFIQQQEQFNNKGTHLTL
jgi:hypothetical protein